MFNYEKDRNSFHGHMSGTLSRRIPYNTKTQIFHSWILHFSWNCDMLYAFPCYLNWYIKNGGHRAHFHAIVLQSATYLCRKPGRIEKKPPFCLCASAYRALRALITRKILRNAIPWNYLKLEFRGIKLDFLFMTAFHQSNESSIAVLSSFSIAVTFSKY